MKEVIAHAHADLLIACPFIRATEAAWMSAELARKGIASSVHLQIITEIRAEAVLNGALELRALSTFATAVNRTVLINVPRIHAKVYVADNRFALITSANLTTSAFDANFEYGVGLEHPLLVAHVRNDLQSYGRLGNVLGMDELRDLEQAAQELSSEFQRVQDSTNYQLRKQFEEKLRATRYEFLRAQVGNRSANSLFCEAIVYILAQGPLSTGDIHPRVQELLPDLCDDSEELIINGEHFGKKWKHAVRNAQQFLKRHNRIVFESSVWRLRGEQEERRS